MALLSPLQTVQSSVERRPTSCCRWCRESCCCWSRVRPGYTATGTGLLLLLRGLSGLSTPELLHEGTVFLKKTEKNRKLHFLRNFYLALYPFSPFLRSPLLFENFSKRSLSTISVQKPVWSWPHFYNCPLCFVMLGLLYSSVFLILLLSLIWGRWRSFVLTNFLQSRKV